MRHSLLRETPVTVEQQQWLKHTEAILEMLNEGVAISDESGRVLFVNECMSHCCCSTVTGVSRRRECHLY